MRAGSLVVLALCLFAGAGVRAADDQATVLRTMLGGGVMPTGGKLSALKDSMMAAAAPISAGLGQIHSALRAQYESVTGQLETVVAAAEAQYCTPPTFVPGKQQDDCLTAPCFCRHAAGKEPATFTGSSMTVTFALGSCNFNEAAYIEDGRKVLNCSEPSISYVKAPSSFTSKFKTAPAFTSKECIVTKVFGEADEKELFNFDGSQAPDMNSIIAKVLAQCRVLMLAQPSAANRTSVAKQTALVPPTPSSSICRLLQITEEIKGVMGSVGSGAADMFNSAKGSLTGGAFGR
ncbi:hypothetical protein D9Q98_006659 [Chlorella vulgaris]|uniref:Uncharacterized protein n=1 Tax=Chlorella vulgaris TaxID=3077 RepID=A0A9D4YVJ3_CHLVU|nr:hypothetical protein D9Q98_006659 [Chlorella vulgaris]